MVEFREDYINKHSKEEPDGIAGVNQDGLYRCDYLAVYELLPHIDKMSPTDVLQYAVVSNHNISAKMC